MNKKELIVKLAKEQNITRAKAEEIIDVVFDTIVLKLKEGEKVNISNFGNFYVKEKKPRVSVIPNTEKRVMVPAYKTAGFHPAKAFKEDVK